MAGRSNFFSGNEICWMNGEPSQMEPITVTKEMVIAKLCELAAIYAFSRR
jgi:hypothetical protein